MRRNNLFKTILIIFFAVLAIITLIPTFQVRTSEEAVDQLTAEISQLIDKSESDVSNVLCGDIQLGAKSEDEGLSVEELAEQKGQDVRTRLRNQLDVTDKEILEQAVPLALTLREKYLEYIKNEAKAIKLGLDLQGGTYLVTEVNVPELIYSIAKSKADFDPLFQEAVTEFQNTDRDFVAIISEKISDKGWRMNRFFGELGESDSDIRSQLDQQIKDAVNRTWEVLRNRIDQYGVSEPNIQKQGDRRIIIELAGVKDINRAKKVIGTTAQLKFQVVESEKGLEDVLRKINRVLKESAESELDSTLAISETETASEDSLAAETASNDTTSSDTTENIADDEIVQLTDLFESEKSVEGDSGEIDTSTAIVDKNTYKEAPFTSLLRIFRGRGYDIGVAPENKAAVDWILSLDKVQNITKDVEFLWGRKTERIAGENWYRLYLVRKNAELTGEYLTDAKVDLGGGGATARAGEATVNMTLNREGANIFSQLTERIINQRLAIVLDEKVASDPVVRVKIPNGRAVIEGMGSMDEANDLALVLRAGALPVPMEFIEERTVGPSLGQDSVNKGTMAAGIGLIVVIIFMVIYYNYFGIVADLALVLNLIFLMAILSGFGFTLTLPGVAGIVLTIGMAVDANVLIFERIREESQTGKTVRAAIENGYGRAFTTILDANVTTLLTALVLYQFGTGPIKGFAVTLAWGIAISMFSAIVVTRVIFDFFTAKQAIKTIPY